MRLTTEQKLWDDLATLDPYWAVLPREEGPGSWDIKEYLESARPTVENLMRRAGEWGHPEARHSALDFGCGVGRLVNAFAEHFEDVLGVDISAEMIAEARQVNSGVPNARFEVNATDDLSMLSEDSLDLVHSTIVLQHVPRKETIFSYIRDFVRVVRPGGLVVFDVPSFVPIKNRVQMRRRLFTVFHRLGVPTDALYGRLRTYPFPTTFVPNAEVISLLEQTGARMLDVVSSTEPSGVQHAIFYATK